MKLMEKDSVLIIGASARAAAMSALRAGFNPIASDLFGDRDLTEFAVFQKISQYPNDFVKIAQSLSSESAKKIPLIYTGALENYPDVLAELGEYVQLLGNSADIIKQIRDPFLVSELLMNQDLPVLKIFRELPVEKTQKKWLRKPYRSAGGSQIQFCDSVLPDSNDREEFYFQEYVEGESLSALFFATGHDLFLLGMTRQYTGIQQWNGAPFSYCGSYGPVRLKDSQEDQVLKIGNTLVDHFNLKGLFGVDLIDDGKSVRFLEVNPRYTASVEVLEFAYERSFMNWHWNSFQNSSGYNPQRRGEYPFGVYLQETVNYVSKAIFYSGHDFKFPQKIPLDLPMLGKGEYLKRGEMMIADVPQPGTFIEKGKPIFTLLIASGGYQELMKNWRN
jgi:uncharacterized protein